MAKGTILQHPTVRNRLELVSIPAKTPQGAAKKFWLAFDGNGQCTVSDGVRDEIAMAVSLGLYPDVLTVAGVKDNPEDLGLKPPEQQIVEEYMPDGTSPRVITVDEWRQEMREQSVAKKAQLNAADRERQERARSERIRSNQ